jgi:hypothetical protein
VHLCLVAGRVAYGCTAGCVCLCLFGFQVPMMPASELPDISSFSRVTELERWLVTTPSVLVQIDNPSVSVNTTSDGTVCGQLSGHVAPSALASVMRSDDALDAFRDSTGGIPITISMELEVTDVDTERTP